MHDLASFAKALSMVCDHADLMDQKAGFDSSTSVWQQTGWAEVDNLRHKLENLKELRELVRQLGRAAGKGPLRMAPQEVSLCLCLCHTCSAVNAFWSSRPRSGCPQASNNAREGGCH